MAEPDCKHDPGVFVPLINQSRCEGKADCVRVCPYNVFEIQPVPQAQRSALGPISRFKLFVHGNKQAYAVNADACRACGLCVTACPEKAITLRRRENS